MTRYEKGFLAKCAEHGVSGHAAEGMLKRASMPGMTRFKDIRQWVNAVRKIRRANVNTPKQFAEEVSEFVGKNVHPKLTRFPSVDPLAPGLPRLPPNVGNITSSADGFPRKVLYRGETLPDFSTGGATSSGFIRNVGPNIRHVTTRADTARGYGGGPVLIYNAKKVPGISNGKLRFGTDREVEEITDGFIHPEKLFGKADASTGKARLKALDSRYPIEYGGPEFNLAGLGVETGIDASRVLPSRVVNVGTFGDAQDVTNLYEYARRQKQFLPEHFDLSTLIVGHRDPLLGPRFNTPERDALLRSLTPRQRLAAERYQAIHDILKGLKRYSGELARVKKAEYGVPARLVQGS